MALAGALVWGAACAGLSESTESATREVARLVTGPVPAWEAAPAPIAEGPVVPQERVHRFQFENGIELFLLEDHSLPRLEVGWLARRGVGSETRAEAGTTVLLTEVMERGAGDRDALALAQAVERLGATLTVAADWDSASVELSGLSEDRDALFEILRDVVRAPRIEAAEVKRARQQQLAGLESVRDNPRALVSRELARVLYPEHRYGLQLSGSPDTVSPLRQRALRAWHPRLFDPSHSIVYAVGDLGVEEFRTRAESLFGDMRPAPSPLPPTPATPAATPAERTVVLINRPDLAQAQIALGHEGMARTDPERVQVSLLNSVLGAGGFASRLMSRIRAEEGLAYGIYSGFSTRSQPGPFSIRTSTNATQAGKVLEGVFEEVEAIRTTRPPTEEELASAKRMRAGRFALGLETSSAIASSLLNLDVHRLPQDSLDTYRTRVAQVDTAAASAQSARLHPERMAIVIAGPAEVIEPQLAPYGTPQIVEP